MEFKKWLEAFDIAKLDPLLKDPHISKVTHYLITRGLQAVRRQIQSGASENVVRKVIQTIADYIEKLKGPREAENFLELAKVTFQIGLEQRINRSLKPSLQPQ